MLRPSFGKMSETSFHLCVHSQAIQKGFDRCYMKMLNNHFCLDLFNKLCRPVMFDVLTICLAGDEGDNFYVIDTGEVDVSTIYVLYTV